MHGQLNVDGEGDQQAQPCNPDDRSVPQFMKPEGVFVDCVLARENEEIANQVPGRNRRRASPVRATRTFFPMDECQKDPTVRARAFIRARFLQAIDAPTYEGRPDWQGTIFNGSRYF